jgi:urea carboxylase-associated protein 2
MIAYEDTIPTGRHWSMIVRRGCFLRLTDLNGGANVGMLFHNPAMPLERLNLPDTLKCQHIFRLGQGHCLYSDMGRIFCSITADTAGWHDAVGGTCDKALVAARWGVRDFQQYRNDCLRNGRDSFLVELAKYGLGKRDLAANVNFFSKVVAAEDGSLRFVPGASAAGATVELRFEMDTLVIMHTCPHPMNLATEYPDAPVRYALGEAAAVRADDECLNSRPENARGFRNNVLYHLGLPGSPVVTHLSGGCGHDH